MDQIKSSSIKVDSDQATAIASTAHGANLDLYAFNMSLITKLRPNAAVLLVKLYNELHDLSPDDPPQPEEDFSKALGDLGDPFKD